MSKTRFIVPLVLIALVRAHAADISHEVRDARTGGFLEAGIGLVYDKVPLVAFDQESLEDVDKGTLGLQIQLDGRIEWRNFFAETIEASFSDVALGYRAWENHNNTIELVFSSQFSKYEPQTVSGFESLESRAADFTLGFRSLHQYDDVSLQLELGHDIANSHNGVIAAALIGRSWQVRNWSTHAVMGLRFFSDDVIDHYFGVSQSEATESVVAYTAGSGTLASADFGAVVPINENWLFRTNLTVDRLPDSVVRSPLATGRVAYGLAARFIYVF